MQKIIIIALLCATAFAVASVPATPGSVSVGTATGFAVTTGVAQVCHRSCATCNGPLISNCLTCIGDATIAPASGTCACVAASSHFSATTGVLICELDSVSASGTATVVLCNSVPGMWADMTGTIKLCKWCDDNCKTCTTTATLCGVSATGCWGGLANAATAGGTVCTYTLTQGNTYSDLEADQTLSATISAVHGYYYDATNMKYLICANGCATCSAAAASTCLTCATGFTAVGTAGTACECSATGFFTTVAGAATLGACTACGTGCTTCSSAAICTVCDSSNELGSTTDSSSTCQALATTTDSSVASSTDGESDGESSATATTDASTTNGVLITAASMLLAVILA